MRTALYKKTDHLCQKILCGIILFFVFLLTLPQFVFAAESGEEENTHGPYPVKTDTFELTWTIDNSYGLENSDVDRLNTNVLIYDAKKEMYSTRYDYAEIVSIDLKVKHGVTTATVVYYPKKAGTIYSMLFLDGEAIGASPPVILKENGFGGTLKNIASTMFIDPLRMLTTTQYAFWKSDTVPILFADKMPWDENSYELNKKVGIVIIVFMVIGLVIAWILKKLQYDGDMEGSVIFLSYLWAISFIISAIFIWDQRHGYYSLALGYTPLAKKILYIGYGIIFIIASIGLIWHIVKRKFSSVEVFNLRIR